MDTKEIIIEPKKFIIIENTIWKNPYISLKGTIPDGYDITGINVEFPDNLKYVIINFGHSNYDSVIFDRDMIEYMKNFPLYLTLCKHMYIDIKFLYDNEWFEKNIQYEMIDEYNKKNLYGEIATIYDGYSYHTGNVVTTTMMPTGNKIRNITKGVEVEIPKIIFNIAKIDHKTTFKNQNVKQKINLSYVTTNEYKEKLFKNHNLTIIDENTGYIDNLLNYNHGVLNLFYRF